MTPGVKLTAYDKQTERLVAAAAVPAQVLVEVRRIARVPASDPDLRGVYPLTPAQVTDIAGKLGAKLDEQRYDYCLESILPAPKTVAPGGFKTKRERARANAARERARSASPE